MQNGLEIVTQALDHHLASNTAKGLYYQAYFQLVESMGIEAEEALGRGLSIGEILFISDRVEKHLKGKVFRYELGVRSQEL